MTRQQYIAELTQLLFYMTPWDRAKAIKKYSKLFETSDNEAALFNELGSPMKLAVTLHRSYEPTPEPTGDEPDEDEEESVAEADKEAPAAEDAEADKEALVAEDAEADVEAPVAEDAEADVEAPVAEDAEADVEAPVAEDAEADKETPAAEGIEAEEGAPAADFAPETIFSEIYSAATDAQSAIKQEEEPEIKTVRKPRYLFLIPYTIFAVLLAIPVVAFLAAVNVILFAAAIVLLCLCLYLGYECLFAFTIGNLIIYGGLALIALAATISMGALGVWFAHAATAGFPRFLLAVARKHGYREEEV